jgi:hypothetical protein
VPEVSRFYGIVITISYDDHHPPHFHARYGGDRATLSIDGIVLAGSLASRALAPVGAWAALRHVEPYDDWERARRMLPLVPIPPLE